jgi:hypothetical protein
VDSHIITKSFQSFRGSAISRRKMIWQSPAYHLTQAHVSMMSRNGTLTSRADTTYIQVSSAFLIVSLLHH